MKKLIKKLGLNFQQFLSVLVALTVITTGALIVVQLIEKRYQDNLLESLNTVSDSLQEAIRVWEQDQRLTVQTLANQPYVREAAQRLLALPQEQEALFSSTAQEQLRVEIIQFLDSGQYRGYFLISPDNINLASSRKTNIGTPNLLKKFPQVLAKLWGGESALSSVLESDVLLTTKNDQHPQPGNQTMFVGAPIKNNAGQVIALLTLRINPYKSLFSLLLQGRIGKSGESYAFDHNGIMLSISRFEEQLVNIGLLHQEQSSAGEIQVKDPGLNLTLNSNIELKPDIWPLTRMAASATQGQNGYDLNGYRDYRGLPVVGVWSWNETLNFGITVEQDMAEAYDLFYFVRLLIYVGAVITLLILLALIMVFVRGKRQLKQMQMRLQAIVETANDAILVIDERGRIESVNPAVEDMFGFPARKLIGNNVNILMPEPYQKEHDGYLENYRNSGEAKVIGIGREVEAKRLDGTTFPINLSVNRLELDSGLHFAGVIHDQTENKRIEKELQDERDFTRRVLDSLAANIAVLDESGRIVMVNATWRQFAEQNGLTTDMSWLGLNYLQLLDQATGENSEEASLVLLNLRDLLAEKYDSFALEYPCHSPQEKRWFKMRASYLVHQGQPAIVVSHVDITKQVEFEHQLKHLNDQLRITSLVAETTDNAVIVTGVEGKIQWVNQGFTQISGYGFDEVLGRKPGDFLQGPKTDRDVVLLIAEAVRLGKRIQGEILNYNKSGQSYWIEFEINPVYDEQGELVQYVALEKNISEQKKSESALIQAREAAVSANRAKSTFLATMSHEIRTPLNGVVGTIDMLTYSDLNQSQRDLINTAKDSALLLQTIINDILDFSKIESGRLELDLVEFNLESLLEVLGDNLKHLSDQRDVELLLYCDPDMPTLKGDTVRLRQILYNLAGNAIKFSANQLDKTGQVVVSVTKEMAENERVSICIRVSDNGIGMSAEVQQRLFNPFVQGEGDTTRRFGGTGLGLVITKRLVELMGGHIEMESAEGKGTSFTVFISLELIDDYLAENNTNLEGIKVLLLNDHNDVTWILKSYLQYSGAEVISVTGDNVLDKLRDASLENMDDIVVIDTHSGATMDLSLRETLRREVHGKNIRFLMMERGFNQYARLKDDDVLVLDSNIMRRNTLLNAVAALVGRESPQQEKAIRESALIEPAISIEEARASGRLILLADDNKTNQKVISQQLQMLGYMAEVADNGKEAISMWRNGSYALVMTDCHMPVMDGYELTETIRREEGKGQHIPIIAITADAMIGAAQKCYVSGMDDYLTKPMELQQLQEVLEKFQSFDFQEPYSKMGLGSPKEGGSNVVDSQALGDFLGIHDPQILTDYYSDFIEGADKTADQIYNAYKTRDLSTLSSLAHKLKSSARTIGANSLSDCCQNLETAGKKENIQLVSEHMEHFSLLFEQVKKWVQNYTTTKLM